jgi:hypothetical protein
MPQLRGNEPILGLNISKKQLQGLTLLTRVSRAGMTPQNLLSNPEQATKPSSDIYKDCSKPQHVW